jgi:hypothetical protein
VTAEVGGAAVLGSADWPGECIFAGREVRTMNCLITAVALVLALASLAQAEVWDFSWTSSTTVRLENTQVGGTRSVPSVGTGTSAAAVGVLADGTLGITFDSPAGAANLQIFSGPLTGQVLGQVPVLVPTPAPGEIITSAPGREPGWHLHPVGASGDFQWTGEFSHPDSFTVVTGSVGSGPDSGLSFRGIGLLRRGGGPTLQAAEPPIAIVVGAALVAVGAWRRGAVGRRPRRIAPGD